MRQKVDTESVRRQNRTAIIEALRRGGPLARIELGEQTGLAAATITAITADLLRENIVREDRADSDPNPKTSRGRPRIALSLNPGLTTVIGVKIVIDSVTIIAADFTGDIIGLCVHEVSTRDAGADAFVAGLVSLIRDFFKAESIELANVAEIRVAAQGFVNSADGTIVWSPAFAARNIPIAHGLSRSLQIDCVVANDANMIAQALHLRNPVEFGGTFCAIMIGYGVGAGLFVNNALHEGETGSAAEFGHMIHVPGGPLCRCGNRGCVEAHIADYALYRDAHKMSPDEIPLQAKATEPEMLKLERQAEEGDEDLVAIYDHAGEVLGISVARLMAMIDPNLVVVTGEGMRAFPLMHSGFRRGLEASLVPGLRRGTEFRFPVWDRDLILDGIVASALHKLDRHRFAGITKSDRGSQVPV